MKPDLKRSVKGLFFCLLICLSANNQSFALDKRTSFALSHYIMATMYDKLGETDNAIEEYKKALKADYKNSTLHLSLAVSYIKKNNLEKAIGELEQAINFDPDSIEPHAVLALIYFLQNKTDDSNREYEVALKNASKLQPKNIDIYKSLGVIYLQKKNLEAAENAYQLILGLSPNDAEAHFYLAVINDQRKNRAKAEEELKKAIESKPDYHEALNYLGYMYVEENKFLDQAEALIKKALELDPDNGAYIDSLGWLHFKQGKIKDALNELQRASSLLQDPVIHDHLGDAYLMIGDTESAKSSWERSLEIDSKQETIRKKLDKLQ